MKLIKTIQKTITMGLLSGAILLAPSLASAHGWGHHHWRRWHHRTTYYHSDPGAILGLLAVGTVAGVIIGAAANDSHEHYRSCRTVIRHHRRVRICEDQYN